MRNNGLAVIVLSLVIGCAEAATTPLPTPLESAAASSHYSEWSPQETPWELPPEYQVPTSIFLEADAGWRYGNAFAGTIVRYTGTHVLARATVSAPTGSSTTEGSASSLFPASRSLQITDAEVPMPECKGTIMGYSFGKVWNEAFLRTSLLRWGEQSLSENRRFDCPVAQTGSASGSNEKITCYTIEIDYYVYHTDTGVVEYLYTTAYEVCEKVPAAV
jgi:hypothetical protein